MRPVGLSDKPVFDDYLQRYPPTASELTFTNVFCWAEVKHHLYCEHEGHLFVSYRDRRIHLGLFPPIGPHPERWILRPIPHLRCYSYNRIDEDLAGRLGGAKLHVDRDNSDYLYRVDALRELRGKKFDGKRNFLRRMEEFQPQVRRFTADMACACLQIQEEWLEHQGHSESAKDESTAFMKAMQNVRDLPLSGIAAFVDGRMVGFAIGEPLNPTTYVEHFEKGRRGYPGIYQFLLHEFAKAIPDSFTYLNREQDLGLEGLRRAKESWHPEHLIKKYSLKGIVAPPRA